MPIKITDADGREHFTVRRFAVVIEFDESSVIADATLFKDGKRKHCEVSRQLKQAGDIVNSIISEAVNNAD
jgi:hypothetical protein